ncbi:MAG: alpha/beta fold hydrolase [Clostridiaceae bacterium]|nr:alpha/beta fold hydrolase [Clostridiaceae bacterium]
MIKRKDIIANNEISEICSFSLGGYEQKVLIEGKRKDSPIVIALHGGPGTPIPFSVGCRGLFPQFTDNFIMVYWDQLGCGINNYMINDTFSIDVFVQMTEELVEQIKMKFPNNKVMIFSTSWGSILSAKLLERNPHAVDAVIACGQIIKNVFICDEVKDALTHSNIPKKKLARIKNVTIDNFTGKDLQLISSSLRKYTDAYQNKSGTKIPLCPIIKGLITSPDYTIKDFKSTIINGYMKNTSLWPEILKINLSSQLSNVQIPYVILQGDTDIVSSTKLVKELVANSDNVNLSCTVIKNTGHLPGVEMMDTLLSELQEKNYKIIG